MKLKSSPFSIPLYHNTLPTSSISQIKEDVLKYINDYPNNFSKTWNCPTLNDSKLPDFSKRLNSKELNTQIKSITNEYFEDWGFEPVKLILREVWVNISPPNAYQEIHTHKSYYGKPIFSGVLYIEADDNSGDLVLHNPLELELTTLIPSTKYPPLLSFIPKTGDIISFPSFLKHEVRPNNNNTNRISVSWNIEAILQNP